MTAPAVILDVDGTLVDSNDAHARAWVEAFAEAGVQISYERARRAIGMGGDKLMPHVSGISEDSHEGRRISERRRDIFKTQHLPHIRSFPRVRDLVERFVQDGLTVVVASSAKEDELGPLLDKAGVADLVKTRTSSDDADNSKPDPDIVTAALKQSRAPRERAVMLGDTPYDVEAARRAGVAIVGVECGGWRREDLRGAAEVYSSPAQLYERYDDTIFARLKHARRTAESSRGSESRRRAAVLMIAAPLFVVGAVLLVLAVSHRRRHHRPRHDLHEYDARGPAGLGPRDRAALRRLIERTS